MTDKDREIYFEVLMALAGHGNMGIEENISHEISHENEKTQENQGA